MNPDSQINPQSPRTPNFILIVFLVVQLVLIILVAISVPRLFYTERISENDLGRQPQVSITNISNEIPALYTDNIDHIQRVLFDVIKQTRPELSTSLSTSLRTDTIKTVNFEHQNTDYFTAIIDVPEVNQAYQIFYGHTNIKGNEAPNDFISVLCAPDTTNCQDVASQPSRLQIVARYLKLFNFNYFSVFIDDDNPTKININPTEYTATSSEKETYIQTTKDAITSLGISPDLFEYEVISPANLNYYIAPENR